MLFAGSNIYVMEFKVGKNAADAIAQMRDRGYAEKYAAYSGSHKVRLLGINFSTKERNVDDWREEEA